MMLVRTIPALPVQNIEAAVAFYTDRFGFACPHCDDGFAKLIRDDVEIHLWAASDRRWRWRPWLRLAPVTCGAETFIAGTASCRIQVDAVDNLYAELSAADVLHPVDGGSPEETDWGTREFATLDGDGNLLTFFERRAAQRC